MGYDILFYILGAIFIYFFLKELIVLNKTRKNLGEIIYTTKKRILGGEGWFQFLFLIILTNIVLYKYKSYFQSNNGIVMLIIFIIFIIFMFFYILSFSLQKKGIYEKGLIADNGAILWDDFDEYEWGEQLLGKGAILRITYQKKGLPKYLRLSVTIEERFGIDPILKKVLKMKKNNKK